MWADKTATKSRKPRYPFGKKNMSCLKRFKAVCHTPYEGVDLANQIGRKLGGI